MTGLLYNVGIWADKFVFWFNPATSESAIAATTLVGMLVDVTGSTVALFVRLP